MWRAVTGGPVETVSAIPSTCVTLPLCIVWVMGILCMDTRVERAEF
jgi:hypothetical protein